MMEDFSIIETELSSTRPSLEQVNAVVDFMHRHPDLATNQLRTGLCKQKAKKLWSELSNIVNNIPGSTKTTQGWLRYWIDKKCMVKTKKKQADSGKYSSVLTPIEERIWNLCFLKNGDAHIKRKKYVKKEVSDHDDSSEELPLKGKKVSEQYEFNEQPMPDIEEKHLILMENLVQVMDRQASALSQLAQASLSNAKAMERMAESAQIQARAVDRLAVTFENIGAAVRDVRSAVVNIDYSMKRCYNINHT